MPADYPPPGTRVRWQSRKDGIWREGIVVKDEVWGKDVLSGGRYYHPRSEWLEIIEEATDG